MKLQLRRTDKNHNLNEITVTLNIRDLLCYEL